MSVDAATKVTMAAMKAAMLARKPLMIVGAPGTGKTATIRQIAKEMNYDLVTVIGSQMDSTDLSGLPKGEKILDDENGNPIYGTVYLAPWWQVRILQEKRVVLFLDEFSNTAASVRASMLTMLQNREFPNGVKMPDETIIIGAMNPAEEAADGYELDLPTTNRLFFIAWNPSQSSWFDGMLKAWGNSASDAEMHWRRRIVGFIKDNPTWLHKQPNDVSTTQAYGVNHNNPSEMEVFRSAWASRRSWDDLSKVLAFAPDDVYTQDLIISGTVGFAASAAFRDWLRKNDVINPQDVINNPKSIDWKKISLDDSNLILRAILEMINDDSSLDIINVFDVVADSGRTDLGAPFIRDLLARLTAKSLSPETVKKNKQAARPLVMKYQSVVKQSR